MLVPKFLRHNIAKSDSIAYTTHRLMKLFITSSIYLLLIWGYCLSFTNIASNIIGYLGTDTIDTLSVRMLLFDPSLRFYPTSFSAWSLTPNIVDHLTAYPFMQIFPFPLGDNLWWITMMYLNAISAHTLGKAISIHVGHNISATHSELHGFWVGCLVLASEPLLREINWGHAPQSMLFACLLSIRYALDNTHTENKFFPSWSIENGQSNRSLYLSAIFAGLAGYIYAFFLVFLTISVASLYWNKWRSVCTWMVVVLFSNSLNIAWMYTITREIIQRPNIPFFLIESHTQNWLWFWNSEPMDTSNQISVVVLGIALGVLCRDLWAYYKHGKPISTLTIAGMVIGLVGCCILQEDIFLHTQSIPILSRLVWAERWGVLVLFSSVLLSTQWNKSYLCIPLLLVEMQYRSHNNPLHTESIAPFLCYQELSKVPGAVLELPIARGDNLYNRSTLYQRLHQRPMVAPFILPPHVKPPTEWEEFRQQNWLNELDQQTMVNTISLQEIQKIADTIDVQAIIVDRSPYAPISEGEANGIKQGLLPLFGKEIDLGCVWIWPIHPDASWTKELYTEYPQISPTKKMPLPSLQEPLHAQ